MDWPARDSGSTGPTENIPPSDEFTPPPPRFVLNFKTIGIFLLLLAGTVYTTHLVGGIWYCVTVLLILGSHEFGHYFACRRNDVDSSLPNFLPAPPFFFIGTFGAFIAIREPIPNRRALMEIGAYGPLAGFVVAVPVFLFGVSNSDIYLNAPTMLLSGFNFGNSLLTYFAAQWILDVDPSSPNLTIVFHPAAYAGWVGLFFTALNLLPMGQLDGGHVVYSLFGKKSIRIARVCFLILFPLGFWWLGWYLWALLVFLMGLKHPPVIDETLPLTAGHKWVGYLSIAVFVLTFVPVPIELIGR